MSERNGTSLLSILGLLVALMSLFIAIAAQVRTIAWWLLLWALPFLALVAIAIWVLHLLRQTQAGATTWGARGLAFGSVLVVSVAVVLGYWGLQRGREVRSDDAAEERQRRAVDLIAEGKQFARDGAHPDAIHAFGLAIDLDSSESTLIDAYRERGRAHATRGEHPAAVKDFTAAIRLYPDDRDSLFERAQSLLKLDQCHQAAADFRAIVHGTALMDALDPEYAPAWHNLALAEASLGRFDKAIAAMNEAMDRNIENAGFFTALGQAHAAKGEREQAIKAFEKAIDLADDQEDYAADKEIATDTIRKLHATDDGNAVNSFKACS